MDLGATLFGGFESPGRSEAESRVEVEVMPLDVEGENLADWEAWICPNDPSEKSFVVRFQARDSEHARALAESVNGRCKVMGTRQWTP